MNTAYWSSKEVVMFNISAGFGQHSLATNITLLRANEVDDIVRGDGEKYKDTGVSSDLPSRRYVAYHKY